MDLPQYHFPPVGAHYSRREAIKRAGAGIGLLALASLLKEDGLLLPSAFGADVSPANPLAPHLPHFAAKAKSVIWLFINGEPSQVDTWDYKPELEKRDGVKLDNFDKFTGFFANEVGPLMKSPFKFQQSRPKRHLGFRVVSTSLEACRQNGVHSFVAQRIEQS